MPRTVTFIATPAKSGMPDGSLAVPVRMEIGTLTFHDGPAKSYVTIRNRSGVTLDLDRDAAAALLAVLSQEFDRR